MPGDTNTYRDILEFKERAIREAYETARKAKSTLPLSERDLNLLKSNIIPEAESLSPPDSMGGYTTYTDYIQNEAPQNNKRESGSSPSGQAQHNNPHRSGVSGNRNPFENLFGGILGNLKSQDLILVAIAFMLFNSKTDNDLLLAIMFILLS